MLLGFTLKLVNIRRQSSIIGGNQFGAAVIHQSISWCETLIWLSYSWQVECPNLGHFRGFSAVLISNPLQASVIRTCFEVGRRYKILNPEKMRGSHGMLVRD